MTVVIQHQPQFVGRLEWWSRIVAADIFIVVDDVKFERSEGQGREYLDGHRITLPVISRSALICDTQLHWSARERQKIVGTVEQAWRGRPYAAEAREAVLAYVPGGGSAGRLLDVVLPVMWHIASRLDVTTRIVLATTMRHNAINEPLLPVSEKMAEQCVEVAPDAEAIEYWAGRSAKKYLDAAPFAARHVAVVPMTWEGVDRPVLDVVAEGGWSAARSLIGRSNPVAVDCA